MADLLADAAATLLSWRYEWLSQADATGAFVTDRSKAALVVPSPTVEAVLGILFDWVALHTAGGAPLPVLVGVAVVHRTERRRVFALLALGAASNLVADALLLTPSGRSHAVRRPPTRHHLPTPGLYQHRSRSDDRCRGRGATRRSRLTLPSVRALIGDWHVLGRTRISDRYVQRSRVGAPPLHRFDRGLYVPETLPLRGRPGNPIRLCYAVAPAIRNVRLFVGSGGRSPTHTG